MRAERRLEKYDISIYRYEGEFDLRFSDVLLPVFEVMPQLRYRHSSPVSLGSHKGKSWFQHSVRELFVVSAHALPQVIYNILDGNGTYTTTLVSDTQITSLKIYDREEHLLARWESISHCMLLPPRTTCLLRHHRSGTEQ